MRRGDKGKKRGERGSKKKKEKKGDSKSQRIHAGQMGRRNCLWKFHVLTLKKKVTVEPGS